MEKKMKWQVVKEVYRNNALQYTNVLKETEIPMIAKEFFKQLREKCKRFDTAYFGIFDGINLFVYNRPVIEGEYRKFYIKGV